VACFALSTCVISNIAHEVCMSLTGNSLGVHNNMMFSTPSRDNDQISTVNCAVVHAASWWYRSCYKALLTGAYGPYPTVDSVKGIKWRKDWGDTEFAKYARMMIRPVQDQPGSKFW
jgi:hypothetical protein